jgi:hypothetical protein
MAGKDKERGDNAMLAAARAYTRQGWRVVPVRPREKGVTLSGWQQLRLEETDLPRWFSGTAPHNIGILTGEPRGGLVDVDCDAPEAALAAAELLPPTGMISGRPGNPASHYWYQIGAAELITPADMSTEILGDPTIPATEKFADVGAAPSRPSATLPRAGRGNGRLIVAEGDGSSSPLSALAGGGAGGGGRHTTMLIELRSTGCQTIAPPSIHPSGEVVRWETDGVPWSVGGSELRRAVAKVAAVALLARHWPGEGQRDEAAKDLAGLLLRGKWDENEVDDFVRLVARIAGDEEWRRRGKAGGTARKLARGGPVTGGPSLAARLWFPSPSQGEGSGEGVGERVVAQVRMWLGLGASADTAGRMGGPGSVNAERSSKPVHLQELDTFGVDGQVWSVASNVHGTQVQWLWPGRVPLGKITVLDGDPGLGKSLVTIDLAARVTRGRVMPDGSPGIAGGGGVVLLSAEDDAADTVRPRLDVAAADVARVLILHAAPAHDPATGEIVPRAFVLPRDIDILEAAIQRIEARLVVIDPLMAYLDSSVNSWRDHDVRAALAPLSALAARMGTAVLILRHLNKASGGNALYRGGGSIGIIGAARSGLLVAKAPDNPEHERILAGTKSNLGAPLPSLRYQLVAPLKDVEGLDEDGIEHLRHVPVVEWLGECALSATALLAASAGAEEEVNPGKLKEAVGWLSEVLADGPQLANELERASRAAGIAERTLRRAAVELKVGKQKVGGGTGAYSQWSLSPKMPEATAGPDGPDEPDEPDESNLSKDGKGVQPSGMDMFGIDGHVWSAGEHAPRCPVTGGPHEYAKMRNAQGRLLCVECEQPRPDPLPRPLP